jgi:CRP-like cAMP-binding protein
LPGQKIGVKMDPVAALRNGYLFADADARTLERLGRSSRVIRHRAGSTLFDMGDDSDGLHIVLSGLVRIWVADPEGRELTLTLLEPGDPFGEIALLDRLPRTASATAIEETSCLLTPVEAMDYALDQSPALARHLIQLLCEILRRNTRDLSDSAFLSFDGRLAQKLHDLALSHAETDGKSARFSRRFSQTELSQMLGVTREAINERLAALAHDGLVGQSEGRINILDLPTLAERARSATGLAG